MDIGIYLYPEGEVPRYVTDGTSTLQADNSRSGRNGGWTSISPVDAGGVRAVDIFIPPHSTQMLRGTWVVQQPTRIHSVRGHMHLRGKYQMMEAVYPDGRREGSEQARLAAPVAHDLHLRRPCRASSAKGYGGDLDLVLR